MKRLEILHDESADVALREEERQQLRDYLLSYMDKVPVQKKQDLYVEARSYRTVVVSLILAIAIVGVGITVVAERSAPGDFLYIVKSSFNEKVKGYFVATEHTALSATTTSASTSKQDTMVE